MVRVVRSVKMIRMYRVVRSDFKKICGFHVLNQQIIEKVKVKVSSTNGHVKVMQNPQYNCSHKTDPTALIIPVWVIFCHLPVDITEIW